MVAAAPLPLVGAAFSPGRRRVVVVDPRAVVAMQQLDEQQGEGGVVQRLVGQPLGDLAVQLGAIRTVAVHRLESSEDLVYRRKALVLRHARTLSPSREESIAGARILSRRIGRNLAAAAA